MTSLKDNITSLIDEGDKTSHRHMTIYIVDFYSVGVS